MGRPIVVWIACTVAWSGSAAVAGATGPGPPPPPPPCSFTLSAPLRDGDSVAVTVQSTGCAALAAPYSAVACLQAGNVPMRCEQSHGDDPARVTVPYSPGVTFVATGRGCAGWTGLSPAPDCQLLGPNSATP